MSVSGEQSCPDNHSSFRCAAANKACNAQTSASSCVTSGTGICDIVIRTSANAFCSCSHRDLSAKLFENRLNRVNCRLFDSHRLHR